MIDKIIGSKETLNCCTSVITDRQHSGPKQHQLYVEQIYNLIKENNHGNQTV